MKVLELFCGTKSFTKVAEARGHECRTLDNDPRFEPTYCMDIMDFDPVILDGWHPDVIWASPPCTCFSVASIGTHWGGGRCAYLPQTADAERAKLVVARAVELIQAFQPDSYFIENPRGVLRKLDLIPFPRKTAWYCQYGDTRAKPTDIWTNLQNWQPKTCHNGSKDHEEARRGAKTGTQGRKGAVERSIVPEKLCLELIQLCERVTDERIIR